MYRNKNRIFVPNLTIKGMKKIALLMVCLPLLMTGCSKDDDLTKPDGLKGTTWKYSYPDEPKARSFIVINFEEKYYTKTMTSAFLLEGKWEENVYYEERGTYVYTPPAVTFSHSGSTVTGTVSGKELTLEWATGKDIYTKQ
jgi:hypothetical protein